MKFNFKTDLRTLDRLPVREGQIYWDYDLDVVRIETGALKPDLHVDFGASPTEAWFDVTKLSTGSRKLMNGPRLWYWNPADGESAESFAIKHDMAVVIVNSTRKCDAHWLDQRVEIPAVGDFRTHDGRWGNLCDSHRRQLTDGKAGLGIGQYFIYETH